MPRCSGRIRATLIVEPQASLVAILPSIQILSQFHVAISSAASLWPGAAGGWLASGNRRATIPSPGIEGIEARRSFFSPGFLGQGCHEAGLVPPQLGPALHRLVRSVWGLLPTLSAEIAWSCGSSCTCGARRHDDRRNSCRPLRAQTRCHPSSSVTRCSPSFGVRCQAAGGDSRSCGRGRADCRSDSSAPALSARLWSALEAWHSKL